MKARLFCILIGVSSGMFQTVIVFSGLVFALFAVEEYSPFDIPYTLTKPITIVVPGVALACGLLLGLEMSRLYSRQKGIVWKSGPRTRVVVWSVLALYLLTWALGGPMVQSENAQWAVNEWKGICEDPDRGGLHNGFPSMQTYITVPILPFIIASYHEYHIWRLAGAGGWDIQLWHVTGVKRLGFLVTWRS